jgi:CO/xanthine dehydrogenase Mo-binding subunit
MPASIGQPLDRVDGKLKVTGKATYTADQNIPNVTHAVLLTSTIAKGRISSIDTSASQRVPGVLAVITHKNHIQLAKDPMKVTRALRPIAPCKSFRTTGSITAPNRSPSRSRKRWKPQEKRPCA